MMKALLLGGLAASYQPETVALLARMTVQPTVVRAIAINQLIQSLKAAGVWSLLDVLYVFRAHSSQAALLNWISTSFNAANSGASFTTDRGFAGDGSSAAISTSYGPTSGQFALNSHAIGGVINTAPSGNSWMTGVGNASVNSIDLEANGSGGVTTRDGVFGVADVVSSTVTGHIAMSRVASGSYQVFRNGASIATNTRALAALPTGGAFQGLAVTIDGALSGYSNMQLGALHYGAGLSAQNMFDLSNALAAYALAVP